MGKFDIRKKIFQVDEQTLKEFPFYQGFYMSDKEFQKDVVLTVYKYGQTNYEKSIGNTFHKNFIGFAKGIVAFKLSAVAKKIEAEATLNKDDYASMTAYGKSYVPQYIDIIKNIGRFEEFKERYDEYASLCAECENNINTLINDKNTETIKKNALEIELKKLRGISKLETIKKNIEKIMNKTVQIDLFGNEEIEK